MSCSKQIGTPLYNNNGFKRKQKNLDQIAELLENNPRAEVLLKAIGHTFIQLEKKYPNPIAKPLEYNPRADVLLKAIGHTFVLLVFTASIHNNEFRKKIP
ncbi:14720_t:CDS:2 [Cetraspora pellucida]|uniref:14720_t:CDS:1 n=1 Tax=Cetraspora pellucida TaxID=1433469 RepID=A0A9N9NW20_9GLOM|nr:14720_t:CDS:2 [Cetraspora pellucida]